MENIPENIEAKITEYQERMNKLSNLDALDYMNDLAVKVEEWRKEYGDNIKKYRLYHVLIGSTPMPGQQFIGFDLPGEDNVESFLTELENKYGSV